MKIILLPRLSKLELTISKLMLKYERFRIYFPNAYLSTFYHHFGIY